MKHAFFWKLMERFGVQGTRFLVQIVLARLLTPEHYGMMTILVVFTNLADLFVQNGFNLALVQNKDVTDEDCASVFWVCTGVSALLYAAVFLSAPFIAAFFGAAGIVRPLRVLALILFPGVFHSVQTAIVSRKLDFRTVFYGNVTGTVVSGLVSIGIALAGGGLWALVVQMLLNVTVSSMAMFFINRWYPRMVCNPARIKVLFLYGWKLTAAALLDMLYQDAISLSIGKSHGSTALGFYNRGRQFPHFVINAANGTVQSVMLPALSAEQDHQMRVKQITRQTAAVSAYLVFPVVMGLAAVATPLVRLLLTEKWVPCVPYLQIISFSLLFYPVHTCSLQAVNAIGRSDISLKLETIKNSVGVLSLVIAVSCFGSALAIASTSLLTCVVSCVVNAYAARRMIGYSFKEQVSDVLPPLFLSTAMFCSVMAVGALQIPDLLKLILQIFSGIVIYVAGSAVLHLKPFYSLLAAVREAYINFDRQ